MLQAFSKQKQTNKQTNKHLFSEGTFLVKNAITKVRLNFPRLIYEISNRTLRLLGQNCKFSRLHCLAIPRRDLSIKKSKPQGEM